METIGQLVDKLTVVNIKLYHQEDIAQEPGADDHQVAEAKRKISVLNLQRNNLIQEIDEFLADVVSGKRPAVVFYQLKDYGGKR